MSSERSVHDFFSTPSNYLHRNFGVRIRAMIVHQILSPLKGASILDLGCGNGGISLPLLADNDVEFVDFSMPMLELVKAQIPPERVKHANLVHNSLDNYNSEKKFGVVLAIGLIAHVSSVNAFLSKVKELVDSEGCVIIQFTDSESIIAKISLRSNSSRHYDLNKTYYRDFRNEVSRFGFHVESEVRYGLQFPGMGRLPDSWLYSYSKWIIKSGLGRQWGSEVIWKLTRKA